jgi:hypothetical protein
VSVSCCCSAAGCLLRVRAVAARRLLCSCRCSCFWWCFARSCCCSCCCSCCSCCSRCFSLLLMLLLMLFTLLMLLVLPLMLLMLACLLLRWCLLRVSEASSARVSVPGAGQKEVRRGGLGRLQGGDEHCSHGRRAAGGTVSRSSTCCRRLLCVCARRACVRACVRACIRACIRVCLSARPSIGLSGDRSVRLSVFVCL